jgi:hypothetical protein
LKGFSYSDVLELPVYERRYFLSLKTREINEQKDQQETALKNHTSTNSKGQKTTNISGDNLKSRMKNGDIPLV